MAVPPNPFSSNLNLRIPQVSQSTDSVARVEINMILDALRAIQQYIANTTPP